MGLRARAFLTLLGGLSAAPAILAAASAPAEPGATACQPPSSPLSEAQRKFHPGHYVSIPRAEAPNGFSAALTKGITGVELRYRWVELEPEQDHYQFTAIARDLAAAKSAGVQLVVLIEDKTFVDEVPTPAYLADKYTIRNSSHGYSTLRWDPYVVDRLQRLTASLGAQFDCDPNFEGVGFQESSTGLDEAAMDAHGYTPEKYRDALISVLRSAATSVPRSRVFWYMNFLPRNQRYVGDIANAVVGTGVVMGGPDILPDSPPLQRLVYPYYDQFQGRLKLFNSMQHNSYRHRHGGKAGGGDYWSMEDLFQFARNKLHVDYIFWDHHTQRVPPDSHNWDDAREVIARHPTFSP
jgi:hypothetical protein